MKFFALLYEVAGAYKYGTQFKTFYMSTGLINIATCLVISFLFYIILCGKYGSSRYATIWAWVLFMLLNASIAIGVVFGFANAAKTFPPPPQYSNYTWNMALLNALYSMVIYLLFSILLKRFSTHAKTKPFKFI